MYEHMGHLKVKEEHARFMRDLLREITQIVSHHNDIVIWSISLSHNGVVYITCEGEEVISTKLRENGYSVTSTYLRVTVYPNDDFIA